jgi:hypothetical protein
MSTPVKENCILFSLMMRNCKAKHAVVNTNIGLLALDSSMAAVRFASRISPLIGIWCFKANAG